MKNWRFSICLALCGLMPNGLSATKAKLDAETCTSLRLEQIKFRQSGVLDDLSKGAEWAKSNLAPDRLREIAHYLELDEQVKFGCRDAKLSPAAEKASEAAARIEINSDADPTAPVTNDPPKPGSAADKKAAPKKVDRKKSGGADKAKDNQAPKASKQSRSGTSPGTIGGTPSASAETGSLPWASGAASAAGTQGTGQPLGFGETTVQPHASP
jgi:hypothetical protein